MSNVSSLRKVVICMKNPFKSRQSPESIFLFILQIACIGVVLYCRIAPSPYDPVPIAFSDDLPAAVWNIPWDIPIEECAELLRQKTGFVLKPTSFAPFAWEKDPLSNSPIVMLQGELVYNCMAYSDRISHKYQFFEFQLTHDDLRASYSEFALRLGHIIDDFSLRYGKPTDSAMEVTSHRTGNIISFDLPWQKNRIDERTIQLALKEFDDVTLFLTFSNLQLSYVVEKRDYGPSGVNFTHNLTVTVYSPTLTSWPLYNAYLPKHPISDFIQYRKNHSSQ